MDASSAGALQASLLQMRSSVQEASVVAAITMLATRPMQVYPPSCKRTSAAGELAIFSNLN